MGVKTLEVVARRASTVMVLRSGEEGLQVFMIQRNRTTGFMPNAWVFPGGRVDDEDNDAALPSIGGAEAVSLMGLEQATGRPFLVAALRETFEETGIWLGRGQLTEPLRESIMDKSNSFADALMKGGGMMDLDRLLPWSWWVTPKIEKRRYDTRFFVVITDGSYEGHHDNRESVDCCWISPADALERAAAGTFQLAPPTWWTLKELDTLRTLENVLSESARRCHRPIQPILEADANGDWLLKLPGHPDHNEPSIPGLPKSVYFEQGRWWASGP